jgi:hypothetical protein
VTDLPEDQDDPPPLVRTNVGSTPGEAADDDWEKWDAEDQSKKLHALFVNRVFVQQDGEHLRMSFGEKVGDDTIYHTSIVVPNADALAFGELIHRMARAGIDHQLAHYRRTLDAIEAHEKAIYDQGEEERSGGAR